MFELIGAIFKEFGWNIGSIILLAGGGIITIRILASRIESLYDKRIEDHAVAYGREITSLKEGHANEISALKEGHANEIAALKIHSEKGWQSAAAFQAQAERLADRYAESTELARDMADELLERRRTRRTSR